MKKLLITLGALFSSFYVLGNTSDYKNPNQREIQSIASFYANLPTKEFLDTYNSGLKVILDEYQAWVSKPLNAKIFDISDPRTHSFLKNSMNTHRDFKNDILAVVYFNEYKYNNDNTSFCFVLYSDKENSFRKNYYLQFRNKEYAISYLISHEFGHCIYRHQEAIKDNKILLNPNQSELFADIFSYAYFRSKGYPDISTEIENFVKTPKKSLVHDNGQEFLNFVKFYNNHPHLFDRKHMLEYYDVLVDFAQGKLTTSTANNENLLNNISNNS